MDLQLVLQDAPATIQIEIRMIRQTAQCVRIRSCIVINRENAVLYTIGHMNQQIAWIAFFSI